MEQTPHPARTNGGHRGDKLVVGWFSFTCCEDSTILLAELLNDHFEEWTKLVEFRHMKTLKTNNSITGLDVAFVEGAISSDSQAAEVREIRENAKYVVAIGACACTGKPSTSRNQFVSEQITERIQWYLDHFDYSEKVKPLDQVIEVDDMVRGCPMNAEAFDRALGKYLELFEVGQNV
ncbi:MAG: hypothetical protein WA982_06345 [Rubrobacteraceae bacterium]